MKDTVSSLSLCKYQQNQKLPVCIQHSVYLPGKTGNVDDERDSRCGVLQLSLWWRVLSIMSLLQLRYESSVTPLLMMQALSRRSLPAIVA